MHQVFLPELPRRQVDRHCQIHTQLILKRLGFAARRHERPLPDGHNQPRLFGQRNKLHRGDTAQLRMRPAQQRLHPRHHARGQRDLRLIPHRELSIRQRMAQRMFHRQAFGCLLQHALAEDLVLVPAILLRDIHRRIRPLQQVLGVGRKIRIDAYPHTRRQLHQVLFNRNLRRQPRHQVGRTLLHIFNRRDIRHHHNKLIAAHPRDNIRAAHRAAQPPRSLDQKLISGRMSQRIVDPFEVVEVNHKHRHLGPIPSSQLDRLNRLILQERSPGKSS